LLEAGANADCIDNYGLTAWQTRPAAGLRGRGLRRPPGFPAMHERLQPSSVSLKARIG